MSESPSPLRVAIVGGGIAGLCAALVILQAKNDGANIDVQVYERAHKFGEIGAGVGFGPNAQRALRLMGLSYALDNLGLNEDDPDLWFAFRVGQKGRSDSDKLLAALQGHDAAKGDVHRADFLDQLIHHIPAEVAHFNHHCTHTTAHSSGITLHFSSEGASDVEADIVIAADGIKSSLRAHLYDQKSLPKEDQEARYAEWIAWRGLVPIAKYPSLMSDGTLAETKQMYLGTDRHILLFPVRNGQLINVVAFVRDPNHTKLGSHAGPWSDPRPNKEELLEDFSNFADRPLSVLKAIENPSIWGIFELPEIKCTMGDRLVLIGDAAHATTPHQGSGAGMAVEDALFISKLLASPSVTGTSPEARPGKVQQAIEVYTEARHERGWLVQKTSHETGLIYEFQGPDGDDTEKIIKTLSGRMQWIWEWDIEAELEKALQAIE